MPDSTVQTNPYPHPENFPTYEALRQHAARAFRDAEGSHEGGALGPDAQFIGAGDDVVVLTPHGPMPGLFEDYDPECGNAYVSGEVDARTGQSAYALEDLVHPDSRWAARALTATEPRVLTDAARCVLVTVWPDGQTTVATREHTSHTWGPPVPLRERG